MHKSEYIEYLSSDDWRERRKDIMELAGWICSMCGGKAKHLHHLKYDNLGNEELDIDVTPLCKDCHDKIHGKGEYGYETYKPWC